MDANQPMDRPARRSTQATVRIALLVLCAIGILAVVAAMEVFSVTESTLRHEAELRQARREATQVRVVLRGLRRAEAARRSYLLTGSSRFRRHFEKSKRQITAALGLLEQVARATGGQESPVVRLTSLATARMRQLSKGLADSAPGAPADAAQSTAGAVSGAGGAGRGVMQRIHALCDQIAGLQEDRIQASSRSLEEGIRAARIILVILLASIVALVTVVVRLSLAYLADRGRVEMGLREATRLASEASAAKSESLAVMSHEVRTPLAGILGYVELLLDEPLNSAQRGYVSQLQSAAVSLSTLVDDILDFSKIEAGEVEIAQAPFSLGNLIADCLSITSVVAQKKELPLREEIDPTLPEPALGDESRLRQVLLNLLNNAVKFTSAGSVTLRVGRRIDPEGRATVLFQVVDTGIGIPDAKLGRLFRHFSQGDSSIQREYGGTGLGLVISKRLVELMGGEIGVASEEGRGSTFWFAVPLAQAESADTGPEEGGESGKTAGGRILLVEDAPQNRDIVRTILERQGHRVDVAGDGEEAVAAARSAAYDLVLMDLHMPRLDGATASRRIRQLHGPAHRVPIVAISADVLPKQVAAFKQAGMDDYLAKPFGKRHLLAKVHHWLATATEPPGLATEGEAACTHDRAAYEELRTLMGEAWVGLALQRLKRSIEESLGGPADSWPDRARLKHRAHRLVSDAAQLGFSELSDRCAALEQAYIEDGEIAPRLAAARAAARRTAPTIDRLLAEIGSRQDRTG